MAAILTLGFLAAPLAAVLLDAPRDAGLVLAMVPFGTLLAARGIVWLEARRRLRVVGWGLLALAILEGASMLASRSPRHHNASNVYSRWLMTGSSLLRHRHTGIVVLLVVAATLYVPALDRAPLHLNSDEVLFGLHAHSLAESGRDANGRLLPLDIQAYPGSNYWLQPIAAYFTALLLTVAPLSVATVRLATVVVGLATILLLYLVALRLFERRGHALLAAALLTFTPAHLIHSRLASDYEYPLPFILGWLLCLLAYLERRRPVLLFAGFSCSGRRLFQLCGVGRHDAD